MYLRGGLYRECKERSEEDIFSTSNTGDDSNMIIGTLSSDDDDGNENVRKQ